MEADAGQVVNEQARPAFSDRDLLMEVEVWSWAAGEHCQGITDHQPTACDRVEQNLPAGESGHVERVIPHIGGGMMDDFYASAGVGWMVTRDANGRVQWIPFGQLSAMEAKAWPMTRS